MTDVLLKHRRLVVVLLVLITALALWQLPRLGFDFTPQVIFQSDHSSFQYLERYYEVFGRDDNILIFALIAPPGARVDDPEAEHFLRTAHQAVESRVPHLLKIDSIARTPVDLERDGVVARLLVASDRRATAILARIEPDFLEFNDLAPVVRAAQGLLGSLDPPEGFTFHLAGVPLARVRVVEGLVGDQMRFLPVTSLLFLVVFFWIFRRVGVVVLCLGAVGTAMLWSVGFLAATGKSIDIINNVLPVLIFVIGSSDAIHLALRYRDELERGVARDAAIRQTVRHLGLACFFTSLTTAIGFASLAAARIDILQSFGLYCAAGIFFSYLLVILAIPTGFGWMDSIERKLPAGGGQSFLTAALDRVASLVTNHPRAIVLGTVAIIALCGWKAMQVEPRTDLHEAISADDPMMADVRSVESRFGGFIPIAVALEWDAGEKILSPDHLNRLRRLTRYIEEQPGVRIAISVADLVDELGPVALTPVAQEAMREVFRPDLRISRIMGWMKDIGSEEIQKTRVRIEERIEEIFGDVQGVRLRVTGDGPVATEGIGFLIRDLLWSFFLAFGIIFVVMVLLLRSWRAALVSMIPNLAPLVLTMGFMGFAGMHLRVTSVVVFSVSLGLAVDDTIHFMVRYAEEWRVDGDVSKAIRRTLHGAGKAILSTTLLLGIGFGVLLLSDFPITRTFALLMEITLVGALVGDLLLLPACLLLIRPFRHHEPVGTGRVFGTELPVNGPSTGEEESA